MILFDRTIYLKEAVEQACVDYRGLAEIKLKETDPEKIEAALYISGLHDLTTISILVPCGSEIAYRNNEFFAKFKDIAPY